MQLLARLVFNGVGVRLQAIDMPLQNCVLALEFDHLAIELLGFLALLLKHEDAVGPKDYVISDSHGQNRSGRGRCLPSSCRDAIERRRHTGRKKQMRASAGDEGHISKF